MAVNLDNLSIEELEHVIAEARERIEHKREEAVARARADIERIAASTGYSVQDLLGLGKTRPRAAAPRKSVAEKYRNPRDPSQSWSGRGKRPRWLQEQLDQGGKLEQFQVR
ncbi:MAG TPA: H-NS histone family protein [Moraxellaceae bacterium]|nr:H-NS histone family protein [Moraxellaceae bacterium]